MKTIFMNLLRVRNILLLYTLMTGISAMALNVTYVGSATTLNPSLSPSDAFTCVTMGCIPPVITISGPTPVCVGSTGNIYTTQDDNTGYTWTVSPDGTITSGTGTNSITVTWNAPGAQNVSVNYTNADGCSALTPTIYPVTVNPLPNPAGTITGTSVVCAGATGVTYSVAPIPNATAYVWTLPPGATIASGSGTNSITVNFANNATSGSMTVYGNNLCGNGTPSPPFNVTVNPLPDPAGPITGTASVCMGSSGVVYSVPPIANATGYVWNVPAGATITSGSNTNTITIDFSLAAVSGIITVSGTNSCGDGTISPDYAITVNPCPCASIPTLSQWKLILLSFLLLGVGIVFILRKSII